MSIKWWKFIFGYTETCLEYWIYGAIINIEFCVGFFFSLFLQQWLKILKRIFNFSFENICHLVYQARIPKLYFYLEWLHNVTIVSLRYDFDYMQSVHEVRNAKCIHSVNHRKFGKYLNENIMHSLTYI